MRKLVRKVAGTELVGRALPDWMLAAYGWMLRNRQSLLIVAVAAFALIIFGGQIKAALVIGIFGVLATFSVAYKRYVRLPPAIELITFATVMVTLAYGPVVGAIFGMVTVVLAEIASGFLDAFVITYVPAKAAIAFIAYWLQDWNIVWIGVMASIVNNVVSQPFYQLFGGVENRLKGIYFLLINVAFNFALFLSLGQFVRSIIA